MSLNVAAELAALEEMPVRELKAKYEEVFGEQCRSNHKVWLAKRIIWRMQAKAEGGLSERALKRAAELANDADLRMKAPSPSRRSEPMVLVTKAKVSFAADRRLPVPGTILTREYKGATIKVMVLDDGFEWKGTVYRSLSAVAKAITGTHTSGFLFFGLQGKGGRS